MLQQPLRIFQKNDPWLQQPYYSLEFSPDSNNIAFMETDNSGKVAYRLWRKDGKELKTLKGYNISNFNLGSHETLSWKEDHQLLKIWSLDGTLLSIFKGNQGRINAVNFSPDGGFLASAGSDGTVNLWNRESRNPQKLRSFIGHTDQVNEVSFSPDGKTLASASDDKTIRLWSQKGELLKTFKHEKKFSKVRFSKDGKTLISDAYDGSSEDKAETIIWDLDGKLLRTIDKSQNPEFMDIVLGIFNPDFLRVYPRFKDGILWTADIDRLLELNCQQVRDYLATNAPEKDRHLCDDIKPQP